jgi:hypothetical protein
MVINTICLTQGLGKHIWDVDPTTIPQLVFLGNIAGSFGIVATAWSKTSFAITLLRLSHKKWMTAVIWFIIVSMNLILGVTAICFWVPCHPIAKQWNRELDGECWDPEVNNVLGIVSGGTSSSYLIYKDA